MTTIKISRNRLLGILLRLRNAFSKYDAPVMRNYKFSIQEKSLIVIAGSMGEAYIKETVVLPDDAINVQDRTEWCVDKRTILSILKALDEQELELCVMEYQMIVKHSCGQWLMPVVDASGYPQIYPNLKNVCIDNCHLTLEAPGMKHWLDVLYPSLAQDEFRPVMNGICFDFKKDGLSLCASDGHKLTRIKKRSIINDRECKFIFPRKAIDILRNVLPKTGNLEFLFIPYDGKDNRSQGNVQIVLNGGTENESTLDIFFNGIDGIYPNYEKVIPTSYERSVIVDRLKLIRSLERCRIVVCENAAGLVRLHIDKEEIIAQSKDNDFTLSSEEHIPCEVQQAYGFPIDIGFKVTNFLKLIKILTSVNIQLQMTDPSRAVIIEPVPQPEVEDITLLLMPMLIYD